MDLLRARGRRLTLTETISLFLQAEQAAEVSETNNPEALQEVFLVNEVGQMQERK